MNKDILLKITNGFGMLAAVYSLYWFYVNFHTQNPGVGLAGIAVFFYFPFVMSWPFFIVNMLLYIVLGFAVVLVFKKKQPVTDEAEILHKRVLGAFWFVSLLVFLILDLWLLGSTKLANGLIPLIFLVLLVSGPILAIVLYKYQTRPDIGLLQNANSKQIARFTVKSILIEVIFTALLFLFLVYLLPTGLK